jgi:hypothetical protein
MGIAERQLRLVQVAGTVFLVLCILLTHFGLLGHREPSGAINIRQFLVIGLALWSGVSGFTAQHRLLAVRARPQQPLKKSTPFSRWRAGHLIRLWSAMAVGLWGLVLFEIRGPLWVVDTLFAAGLILLMTWRPGANPTAAGSMNAAD